MLLDLFGVLSVEYIFDGLEKIELLSLCNLICQAMEHAVHILANVPATGIMTVFVRVIVPDQSAFEHGDATLQIHRENGDLGMRNDAEKLLPGPFGIEFCFNALVDIRART